MNQPIDDNGKGILYKGQFDCFSKVLIEILFEIKIDVVYKRIRNKCFMDWILAKLCKNWSSCVNSMILFYFE